MTIEKFNKKTGVTGIFCYVLLFCFLLVNSATKAQDETIGESNISVKIGGKIGYTNSAFRAINNYHEFAERKSGFTGGIVLNIGINDWLEIGSECTYSMHGTRDIVPNAIYPVYSPVYYNGSGFISNVSFDVTLHNVEVPLYLKLKMPGGNDFTPYCVLGADWVINAMAQTRILRNQSVEAGSYMDQYGNVQKYYSNNRYTKYDDITSKIIQNEFAPIMGLGASMQMGKLNVFGELRCKWGVTSILNEQLNEGFTSNVFSLSVGILYPLVGE